MQQMCVVRLTNNNKICHVFGDFELKNATEIVKKKISFRMCENFLKRNVALLCETLVKARYILAVHLLLRVVCNTPALPDVQPYSPQHCHCSQ